MLNLDTHIPQVTFTDIIMNPLPSTLPFVKKICLDIWVRFLGHNLFSVTYLWPSFLKLEFLKLFMKVTHTLTQNDSYCRNSNRCLRQFSPDHFRFRYSTFATAELPVSVWNSIWSKRTFCIRLWHCKCPPVLDRSIREGVLAGETWRRGTPCRRPCRWWSSPNSLVIRPHPEVWSEFFLRDGRTAPTNTAFVADSEADYPPDPRPCRRTRPSPNLLSSEATVKACLWLRHLKWQITSNLEISSVPKMRVYIGRYKAFEFGVQQKSKIC